ncbi:hypothetical protein [Blastopirellula marina]|uniref:hypothetical protein n=1 Tax=Blastopirellula marina TaxID=124 RepID=UPI000323BABE|nr:hypothetical protein [Blastopirellula marina]
MARKEERNTAVTIWLKLLEADCVPPLRPIIRGTAAVGATALETNFTPTTQGMYGNPT